MQDRFAVAADLRKIARLLRIKGENLFKAQAYERAASALENLEGDFDALVKAGRLQDIPGVLGPGDRVELHDGHVFGELAALTRTPRSATVIAQGRAQVLEIRWQGLRDLMKC